MSDAGGLGAVADAVASVETFLVRVPLERPLHLGRVTIAEREYGVVRVTDGDGRTGCAYGLTRGVPVTDALAALAPSLLAEAPTATGLDPGAAARAASLLDIALWDLHGKREGLPVWRLLGGEEAEAPCILVAGYPTGEPPEVVGERVAERAREGHDLLKLARIAPPGDLRRLLERAAAGAPAGARFITDAAWCWSHAAEALAEIEQWADAAPLAWIEDPMPPEQVDGYAELVADGRFAMGVGDDLIDASVARRLLGAGVALLRIDAATVGGITRAWELACAARGLGIEVSFHVYPETHVHLAAALGAGATTETFGVGGERWDPAPLLYSGGPAFAPGRATAPDAPGLGIELDLEWIGAHRAGGETIAA